MGLLDERAFCLKSRNGLLIPRCGGQPRVDALCDTTRTTRRPEGHLRHLHFDATHPAALAQAGSYWLITTQWSKMLTLSASSEVELRAWAGEFRPKTCDFEV